MGKHETPCPTCSADIPLSGDEVAGDEIFCATCGAPCKLSLREGDDEDLAAEEDF